MRTRNRHGCEREAPFARSRWPVPQATAGRGGPPLGPLYRLIASIVTVRSTTSTPHGRATARSGTVSSWRTTHQRGAPCCNQQSNRGNELRSRPDGPALLLGLLPHQPPLIAAGQLRRSGAASHGVVFVRPSERQGHRVLGPLHACARCRCAKFRRDPWIGVLLRTIFLSGPKLLSSKQLLTLRCRMGPG